MRRHGSWRTAALALAGLLASDVACQETVAPARDQWKVYLGTDAPIPQLGEQLLIELLDDAGNPQASSQRVIDASQPSVWPISFGIEPSSAGAAPPRVHARLYRLEETGSDGQPTGTSLIDATAALPPASGVTSVGMPLATGCFSVLPDLAGHMTCDPASATLAAEPTLTPGIDPSTLPAPGSWPPAASVRCAGDPPEGMVCIPGGAFLMGTTRFTSVGQGTDPAPQHLVQLDPFAIDAYEMTVKQVRELALTKGLPPPVSQNVEPGGATQFCTYLSSSDSSHDDLPANCVTWAIADAACKLLGKRLPTEAEWEYAARNLDQETSFPWGLDTAICSYAVVARSNVSPDSCLASITPPPPPGPVAALMPTKDATALGVFDLGGNLTEWVADFFASYSGPCWQTGSSLLVNPVCAKPDPGFRHGLRGGAWDLVAGTANGATRESSSDDLAEQDSGFRCVRSM